MSRQPPIKVIYFGPRPDDRSPAEFRERWRQHGHLAMGLPIWDHHIHYEQVDALGAGEAGVSDQLASATRCETFGGVGMIWIRDADAFAKVMADTDGVETMIADEIVTFGAPLGDRLVPTTEHVVFDRGEGDILLIGKVFRQPHVTREEFSQQWKELGRQFAEVPELTRDPTRYVQNHAIPEATGCDGYVQLEFESAESIARFLAEPKLTGWMQPTEAAFVDPSRLELIVGRRNVLYDEATGFSALPAALAAE